MITLKQIMTAINDKLEEILPNIDVQSTDIKEGFSRPSLYVDFERTNTIQFMTRGKERTISVTIYYFPRDRYDHQLELLEVQDILEGAFRGYFAITDYFGVQINEIDSTEVDGVLQSRFDIHSIEIADSDDGNKPFMEHLKENIKQKEG
ncbi:DUF6838 family protein [Paenibacillus thailandensis]|uniref:DUF6838 family protein n=1 Tax=Paenibacillus thailandensis TaxID=393250 RepID=A0ABW5R3J1_9BACL